MGLLRRRTVRLRFTVLYGALFLLSGIGALAIAGIVAYGGTRVSHVAPGPGEPSAPPRAQARIDDLQRQLAEAHSAQSREILVGSVVALCVMVVVSVVLGWFVAGRVLRPLRTMAAATRRITADNLHARLGVGGPRDEVKDLADTIDELLERLEGAFSAQRGFVANASHELRTPLTTMRASLDVAVAKPDPVPAQTVALADRLRAELDQVDGLLDGFLLLARTQHGDLPDHAEVALDDVASAALAARAGDISARGLTIVDAIEHTRTPVRGNPTLLRRMVDNVIDNAIGHNQDGGWIRVTVRAGELAVETGGPRLDPRQVAELGRPFRRLGADRTGAGAGLGLSIVSAIATAHGGALDLHARSEGGLLVTITLPTTAGVPA